jgi:high affinity sulfate transporter 1
MSSPLAALVPPWLRSYDRAWFVPDVIAGVTLAAVAIPECMGYTSIAQTPVVTGLYTVIFPTLLFVFLGSSRLLVVGADSATAAILAAGLTTAAIPGATPGSSEWLAYTSLIALICGVMLIIARIFKLGFIGDFLSASVLIGFLTGVGVQVFTGQIPDLLGVPKGSGNWFQQQWAWMTSLGSISWPTFAFGAGTIAIILGFKRFVPKVPGAIVAVILSIAISAGTDAQTDGVAIVGPVAGGFPPIGLPQGISLGNIGICASIAFSCFVLIIAQSAATSRSFAMKNGQKVDVNRDILGLSGANFAAGLSGTFVVNGSPTKTQILDEQKGRTQLANLTMAIVVLLVVLFFTALLTDMPTAVLAGIVFLIGVDLVDVKGPSRIRARRKNEFIVATVTAITVCVVGVEQGIILAIVLSILDLIRRQYAPANFVVGLDQDGHRTYQAAAPGTQTEPGLIVFRYDAQLFYANANRFVDDVEGLIEQAPDPVTWLVADASALTDIDYSAGISLGGLIDYLQSRGIRFVLAGADGVVIDTMETFGLMTKIDPGDVHPSVSTAIDAFRMARTS